MTLCIDLGLVKKYISMIRKYHNHTLQTYPRHQEEEPKNANEVCGGTVVECLTQDQGFAGSSLTGCIAQGP